MTAEGFEALYLQHNALPTDAYESLKFWIHGGATGGQTLNVEALRRVMPRNPRSSIGPLAAGAWQEFVIPLAQLGVANVTDLDGHVVAGECRRHAANRSTWTTSISSSRRRRAW